jgi:hypothetical protein
MAGTVNLLSTFKTPVSGLPNPLLDDYSGASHAYSVARLLRTAYGGNCIRVRRSSDNTEQNIGFSSGLLDTASLLSFCGAGSGYVKTLYDQSGNGYDFEQTTMADQPRIVNSGVVDTLNGYPSMYFDSGRTMHLERQDDEMPTGAGTYLAFSKSLDTSVTATDYRTLMSYGGGASSNAVYLLYGSDGAVTNGMAISQYGQEIGINSFLNTSNILYLVKPASTGTWYLDMNTSTTSGSMTTNTLVGSGSKVMLGYFNITSIYGLYGYISEFVTYASDKSADKTAMKANLNSLYAAF